MSRRNFCDGLSRRSLLRVGTAGLLGMNLTLPQLLAAQQKSAEGNDLSLIYVFLKGGLSTIDTFDLKPDAAADIRGDFGSIATNLPGVRVCEHLPLTSQRFDAFSLIRSFTHSNSNHGQADHYMLTAYPTMAGFNGGLTPNNQRPSFGSCIAAKLGPRGSVPPYVCLPDMHSSAGSSYLGATAAPFVIDADPSAPGFAVPDLAPPLVLESKRLALRQELLGRVDRYQQSAEVAANQQARTLSVFREKAFDLMTSPQAKQAFDIEAEPEKLRDEYGRHTLGQSCLMARRLVDAGVRCVTIDHTNWDTHDNNFVTLKDELLPQLDTALSALFRDLADRGQLQRTLVLVTGEFGRTPRINKKAGRDHWGPCFTVLLGGGGIAGGRIIGASDEWAQKPVDNPHGPEDLAATVYHQLGIDPKAIFYTGEGRPIPLANGGRVMRELI